MIGPGEDRGPPMTPQLALRVAIVGTCALVMFAVIFFRLWFLQVLSGDQYVAQATTNFVRDIDVAAPRGELLDRNGTVLVDSEPTPTVEIATPDLPTPVTIAELIATHDQPPANDTALYVRLARVLGMSDKPVKCLVDGRPPPAGPGGTYRLAPIACLVAQGVASLPYGPNVTIRSDVSKDIELYLGERQVQFPGVDVQQKYLRQYPYGDLAAQLIGTVGPNSCVNPSSSATCETHQKRFKGVNENAIVGQSGVEWEYDQWLRGSDGAEKVKINALGQFEGYGKEKMPTAGDDLKLSIDLKLQKVGEQALAESISRNPPADGGAFVAMNPQNGQVYAMGSAPTYNPAIFTHPITTSAYEQLNNAASGYPLINRAIQSAGPTGSTFKVITATAALQSGSWLLGDTFDDTGQFCFSGTTDCLHNSGHVAYGVVNLVSAIKVSDDVFFYNLGARLNANPVTHPNGGALQQWAHRYGIGLPTGVDLPGEVSGTLPSPNYLKVLYQEELQCENATGPFRGHPKHPASTGGCGIAQNPDWTIGDNVNTGVGQGDVQVTPLQLAVVYAAVANGGTIVRPHVGLDVQNADGTVLAKINPPAARHLNINPTYLDAIRQGLREAASVTGGTSADVMGSFPEPVYGKTGTAQYINPTTLQEIDTAWYACFVPATATSKPIVIVVTVQKGGFGDVAAAPVARQLLSQWFFQKPGQFVGGTSTTL